VPENAKKLDSDLGIDYEFDINALSMP